MLTSTDQKIGQTQFFSWSVLSKKLNDVNDVLWMTFNLSMPHGGLAENIGVREAEKKGRIEEVLNNYLSF